MADYKDELAEILEETVRQVMRWNLDASSIEFDVKDLKTSVAAKLDQLVKRKEKEARISELEDMRHLVQEWSHDDFCEKCQGSRTLGCYTTNRKINKRLKELEKL